jgi:hypothetical protein
MVLRITLAALLVGFASNLYAADWSVAPLFRAPSAPNDQTVILRKPATAGDVPVVWGTATNGKWNVSVGGSSITLNVTDGLWRLAFYADQQFNWSEKQSVDFRKDGDTYHLDVEFGRVYVVAGGAEAGEVDAESFTVPSEPIRRRILKEQTPQWEWSSQKQPPLFARMLLRDRTSVITFVAGGSFAAEWLPSKGAAAAVPLTKPAPSDDTPGDVLQELQATFQVPHGDNVQWIQLGNSTINPPETPPLHLALDGLVWMHGVWEAEYGTPDSRSSYGASLHSIFEACAKFFGNPNLPIFLVQLPAAPGGSNSAWDEIRNQQKSATTTNVKLLPIAGGLVGDFYTDHHVSWSQVVNDIVSPPPPQPPDSQ